MSIFGRIGNLAKGVWKTTVSPREGADEALLEAELAKGTRRERTAAEAELKRARETPPAPETAKGPQRDEHGNIKKTL